mgnify:CR=1 FL=1
MATTIMELYSELQAEWQSLNDRRVKEIKRILSVRKTVSAGGFITNRLKTVGTIYLTMPGRQLNWAVSADKKFAYRINPETKRLGRLSKEAVEAIVKLPQGPFFEGTSFVSGRRVSLLSRPDGLCIAVAGIPGYILLEYLNGNPVRLSDEWETEKYPLNVAQVPMLADILQASFDED